jgi:hypothetical protein
MSFLNNLFGGKKKMDADITIMVKLIELLKSGNQRGTDKFLKSQKTSELREAISLTEAYIAERCKDDPEKRSALEAVRDLLVTVVKSR